MPASTLAAVEITANRSNKPSHLPQITLRHHVSSFMHFGQHQNRFLDICSQHQQTHDLRESCRRHMAKPCDAREELLRKTLSRLAVRTCMRRACALASRNAVRHESSHCSATRVIGAHDLTEKDPKRRQWSVDAFIPRRFDRVQRLFHSFTRQDIVERQLAFLKKLLSKKLELTSKRPLVTISHLGPPCR